MLENPIAATKLNITNRTIHFFAILLTSFLYVDSRDQVLDGFGNHLPSLETRKDSFRLGNPLLKLAAEAFPGPRFSSFAIVYSKFDNKGFK